MQYFCREIHVMLTEIKEILFALKTVAISFMDTPFLASLPLLFAAQIMFKL